MAYRIAKRKHCGKLMEWYASKGEYYCHECHYVFTYDGKALGYHGSGKSKASWEAEERAWAVAHSFASLPMRATNRAD